MLTRIDFLKNNDLVERLGIIFRNSLHCKEQTVALTIISRILQVLRIIRRLEKRLGNGQEEGSSQHCAVQQEAQPSSLI